MKTIFITISRGSLIRNFFHTGVISGLLEKGFRVVVLTPHCKDTSLFKDYLHKNLHFEPLEIFPRTRLRRLFIELYKGAVFNETVHARYRNRVRGSAPSKALYVPRMLFFAPLRYVPGAKTAVRFLSARVNPHAGHDHLFGKYRPDLVFNTAAGGDGGVLKSAKRFGVKTVDMPKSWDNASKQLFDPKADYLIVWSKFMRRQAARLQGYKDESIFTAGVPQFDFYAKGEGLVSRDAFCRRTGLDPQKKIILYGSTGSDCCDEAAYVRLINDFVEKGILNVQVLVRPHLGYVGDDERFSCVLRFPNFVLDRSAKQNFSMKDNWDPSLDHAHHLYNSLYHADVCVNIASTLSLDALACGTPVVNVKFDEPEGIDPQWSPRRLYEVDYVRAIEEGEGTYVARSKDEFITSLKDVLERGGRREREKEMLEYLAYKCDGKAAERIVGVLSRLAG